MSLRISYATVSENGDMTINEDAFGVVSNGKGCLFVLCDGLGGHGMGDVASQMTVEIFKNSFAVENECTTDVLKKGFETAYKALLEAQSAGDAHTKMKTTAVVLAIDGKTAYIGHVGDSRLYAFENGNIVSRTRDHSIPQILALSGEISENDIRHHPQRNMLIRVLGTEWDTPKYEISSPIPIVSNNAFLLCSDGFWELIEDYEMSEALQSSATVSEWLTKMTNIVRNNGSEKSMDNYTAIAVWLK